MTNAASFNPHKEEDEGYLAAASGLRISNNPYPSGTIRYDEWRRGWQIRVEETRHEKDEGYLAAEAGLTLGQNPHPKGTIRYADWQRGWRIRRNEVQRTTRLARLNGNHRE